jgi:hypothetical protein
MSGRFNTPLIRFIFSGYNSSEQSKYAQDILSDILSATDGSYIDQLYVHDKDPWLINVSVSGINLKRSGFFGISGQLSEGKDLDDFRKQFDKDMESFCSDEVLNDYNVSDLWHSF